MTQSVTIHFLGQPYTFETEKVDDTVRKASEMVSLALSKFQGKTKSPISDRKKVAFLISVALEMANKNNKIESDYKFVCNQLSRRFERVINKMDGVP